MSLRRPVIVCITALEREKVVMIHAFWGAGPTSALMAEIIATGSRREMMAAS
jgi:hypothetical protein